MIGKRSLATKSLDASTSEQASEQLGVPTSVLVDVKTQGTSTFRRGDTLRLEIEGSPDTVSLAPKQETIFGRRDPATGATPDVDLTPFAGYRMGVSRRHAAIRHGDGDTLDLWDLGSSNGTFLNGQRLSAHRPYRLHDGDELRLGQMQIKLYYELSPQREKEIEEPIEVGGPTLVLPNDDTAPPDASAAPAAPAAAPEAAPAAPESAPAAPAAKSEAAPTAAPQASEKPAPAPAPAEEQPQAEVKPAPETASAPAAPAPEPSVESHASPPDQPAAEAQKPDEPAPTPPAVETNLPGEASAAPPDADQKPE